MRLGAILSVAVGVLPSAAHADWQYSRWGMSPEQAVAASNGTLRLAEQSEVRVFSGGRERLAVVGTYNSNGRMMNVSLVFSQERGLNTVLLKSANVSECGTIKTDMEALYGEPFERRDIRPISDARTWLDRSKGNRVTFTMWYGNDGCSIHYYPLSSGADTGL